MAKHTPGPWSAVESGPTERRGFRILSPEDPRRVYNSRRDDIATIDRRSEHGAANAALIAAAPEMLATLKVVKENGERETGLAWSHTGDDAFHDADGDDKPCVPCMVSAVLAKAGGKQ